jgi:hypothetical protein
VHSRLSPTPKIHFNFELKLTRLSSLPQIIVNITSLDAFSVVTDILNFLEESKRSSSEHVQMERSHELLELLNTLINTTEDNIVILNKENLQSVLTCLQVTQAKVRLLQAQSQLLNDELINLKNQQPMKYFELFFVQNNPLYDDDDDDDFDQQSVKEQINKPTSEANSNENESQAGDAKAQSDTTSISESKCEACHQVQHDLSKPIIRPWEELHFNRNRHGLGYENQNNFHIPNYSKPILFVSAGLLQENSTSNVDDQDFKCQHCNRVGHMENNCFDLHPCQHCGKHNHSSERCSTLKKPTRLKLHYEWIDP